ncbi:MAG: DUF998 domain-containing protein [Methanosphaera sp.]|nr:DUF998 domain-containing protein [Methanosphaera sp.]
MKSKLASSVFLSASTFYILAEAFCALFFKDSLINTYLIHTISELGIPGANSPYSIVINLAFILMGLAVLFGNYYYFKKYITKNRIPFYILTLVTAVGVIIVGLIHGGNPLTSGYHTLGAVMAILGGNILLILISRSMKDFNEYQKMTLVLGIIGLIAFWIMFFSMRNVYMPVLERISVYTLILWSFITGIYCNKN